MSTETPLMGQIHDDLPLRIPRELVLETLSAHGASGKTFSEIVAEALPLWIAANTPEEVAPPASDTDTDTDKGGQE